MHRQVEAERARKVRHAVAQFRGRVQGAEHVVVMRHGGTEQRHDRVADVLVDRATVPLHDLVGNVEIAIKQCMQPFVRQIARQDRETAEISKQHRDRPALSTVRR